MSNATEIISALRGNPRTGMCRCPAHDDTKPSLHVSTGRNGKPVVKCHAGCSQDKVIAALRQRGLWSSSDQSRITPARQVDDRDQKLKAAEEYENWLPARTILYLASHDAKARTPGQYLRERNIDIVPPCAMILPASKSDEYLGRRFPAMVCPITDGKALIGAHTTLLTRDAKEKLATETPRKSFGRVKSGYVILSELDASKPLVIGEGIESTLSAMQLSGFPGIAAVSATNMPCVRPPKCREVIIAADNDDAGRKAAASLAERLDCEGHRVRIAIPPVEGADWNDRLLESDNVQEEWRAALQADNREAPTGPISALEEKEFMTLTFPKRELHLKPWLPHPGITEVHAQRGEGKTWFALAVGKAVAEGSDLLGWPCLNSARVLYVDGELPGDDLQKRLGNFRRSPPGMFHVLCRDTFHLRRQMMPNLGDAAGREELDRIIERCRADLVILDSISTLVRSGIENEAESWAPIQEWLLQHRWQGRTIMFMHHQGKSGQPRGTSKREDVLDTVIKLEKLTNDDDGSADHSVFELTFTKARDFFGQDAESLLISLAVKDGQVEWSHEKARSARETKVRELLEAGEKQAAIAKEVGLSKGRVSQIVKRMRQETNGREASNVKGNEDV